MRRSKLNCFLIILFTLLIFSLSWVSKSKIQKPGLVIWHWMTDRQPAFEELARIYEKNKGIKVNFELYAPSDAYSQKVRASAQGRTLPDIFGVLGEKSDFARFVKAGHILDLTSYMEENNSSWKNRFFPEALAVNEFSKTNLYGVKPGIYGVPIDVMTILILYNKRLFKELGLNPEQPPKNFKEWLDLGRLIKDKGLQGLVSGWSEIWLINCFAYAYAFNLMGEEKVFATIRGEVPYTDPDWIKVLSIFKEMKEAGILSSGILTMINKTAEQVFANEKAVFAFNGSWCINVYRGMNPNLDYGVMLPPKLSDKYPLKIWGAAGSSFVVNAHSKNKEEAVRFLKWLTEEEQQNFLLERTYNLPANKNCFKNVSGILREFAYAMQYATHPNAWDLAESPVVNEVLGLGIQGIILGEKTPQEVAIEVQRIKEKELSKIKQ